MFSLISNTNQSHKEKIIDLFDKSDEIAVAVGFLKKGGLRNIENHLIEFCNHSDKKIIFYVGTGFGETDPKTLIQLFDILKSNPNSELILCTPNAGIFHPKIYVFKNKSSVKVIVGSANLTEAGLLINDEISVLIDADSKSKVYHDLDYYLKNLYANYRADDTLALINEYKRQLSNYKKDNRPPFYFRREKSGTEINMPKLLAYYDAYTNSDEFIDTSWREGKYNQARNNLLTLSSKRLLSDKEFHDLFGPLVGHQGYRKLWHSGSIHRTTHETLNYANGFRKIVRAAAKFQDLPVPEVFDKMVDLKNEMKSEGEIFGVGENILTEILMSFNPQKFANLNVNPIEVLKFFDKELPSVASFKGSTYEEYITLLTIIRKKLKMKSFLEIDSFFNYVYWVIQGEK